MDDIVLRRAYLMNLKEKLTLNIRLKDIEIT